MPVESIKSIELINNPSAKYEADGRAVLRIERTENYVDGYQVGLRNVTSKRRGWNNWASSNLNFKKGKIEARLNFGFNKLRPFEGHMEDTHILIPDIITDISSETLPFRTQFTYSGGLFYKLNKEDYISLYVSARDHADEGIIFSTTTLEQAGLLEIETLMTEVPEIGDRGLRSANINYNKSLKSIDGNLFVGGQVSQNFRNNDSNILVSTMQSGVIYEESRDQDFSINSTAIRVDFEKQMKNMAKFETGINISNTMADSFSEFIFFDQTPTFSNAYDYSEANFAGYIQYIDNSKPLKYNFGVRAERNIAKGKFENEDEFLVDRDQLNFFPRLRLSYKVDSLGTFTLDYTRSVQRPHFLNATTISTFIGPVNEYSRNINLQSAFNDELSLTYQFGRQSIAFRYSFSRNPTLTLREYDQATQRIITSPENWETSESFRLVYIYPLQKKKWRSTFYLMPMWNIQRERRALATTSRPNLYYFNSTHYQVTNKTSLGLRIWGLTNSNDGVFENRAYSVLGASLQHNFSKHFSFTFNANDILRQWTIRASSTINDIFTSSTRFTDAHEFSLTLSYKFGKQFKSNYKNEDIDENLKRL